MFGKLFEPRMGLKQMATLCRRLSMSLKAGVDIRTVWKREASSARGLARRHLTTISDEVAQGSTIGDALEKTGGYLPEFFRELVGVGEGSGHLPEVLRQLAEHYEHQVKMRRNLVSSLTWPILELTLALGVVGLLIFLMGALPQLAAQNIDILGFGLTGTDGLIKYLMFLGLVALTIVVLYRATTRGVLLAAPVQKGLMYVPKLGPALETIAMSRLTWAMHVTLNSGMDLRKAMQMSVGSTHNVLYTRHTKFIMQSIRDGNEIHEALRACGDFPLQFCDAVQVGEDSGQLVESMANLSEIYQDEARLAMNSLNVVFGVLVWMLIVGVLIFLIFRIAGWYVDTIMGLSKGKF